MLIDTANKGRIHIGYPQPMPKVMSQTAKLRIIPIVIAIKTAMHFTA